MRILLTVLTLGMMGLAALLNADSARSADLTIKLTNNNTAYSDDQVYVAILGRKATGGPFYHYNNRTKQVEPISTSDNTIKLNYYPPSTATGMFANYFFTLKDAPTITIDEHFESGRIYVALGDWLPIQVDGPTAYSPPSATNNSLPGYQTIFDKIEFTYQPDAASTDFKLFVNTTSVDFVGIPLTLQVDGETSNTRGFTATRNQLIQAFKNSPNTHFADLVIANPGNATGPPLRILASTASVADMSNVMPSSAAQYFGHFYDSYIDDVWNQYKTQSLTIKVAGTPYTGQVDQNDIFNWHPGLTTEGAVVLRLTKPTSTEVLACNGPLASGNAEQKNIEKFLAAAFVRGVIRNEPPGTGDNSWCGIANLYYKKHNDAPIYYYPQILHAKSRENLCYGFSYDDVCDQSSTLKTKNVSPTVNIGIDAW